MNRDPIRALIVDDSATYRRILSSAMSSIPNAIVVGTAKNGREAISKVRALQPDLVTLDLEMPMLDGFGALSELQKLRHPPKTVLISSTSSESASKTLRALHLGAFDFVPKPEDSNSALVLTTHLTQLVNGLMTTNHQRFTNHSLPSPAVTSRPTPCVVGIGISTGGPAALSKVLPKLPDSFKTPILIVQHMPALFTQALAESLDQACALSVVEANHGMPIEEGKVYIAPGDKQMKVSKQGAAHPHIVITHDPPEEHCRPSVNYLFRSLAQVYKHQALGIVMTGMGVDGTEGLQAIKKQGGAALAQDQASSSVFGMPRAAIQSGVDAVLPLSDIASTIVRLTKG